MILVTCDDGMRDCGTYCLPSEKLCNGVADCYMIEDEETNCVTCQEGSFHCDDDTCIKSYLVCDGSADCANGEDEDNCTYPRPCEDPFQMCGDDSRCIHPSMKCDMQADCFDFSDEEICDSCEPPYFHCQEDLRCIPQSWECDGYPDCSNGTDEVNCGANQVTCSEERFQCIDGTCINPIFRCDGAYDCRDDERNCTECKFSFLCFNGTESHCIPSNWECDGYPDCEGGEDEANCDFCQPGFFKCMDGRCIPDNWRCDGIFNCGDADDEMLCNNETDSCPRGYFMCPDLSCIMERYRCDGETDCFNAEDEMNCDLCGGNAFLCESGNCISSYHICDGILHCENGTDENNCTENVEPRCPVGYLMCANGTCYNPRYRCDNHNHCTSGDDEENCGDSVVTEEIHSLRMKCSRHYSDLTKLLELNITDATTTDLTCDTGNGTYDETSTFSPLCQIGIFCDHFGCYDSNLKWYREVSLHGFLCSLCARTSGTSAEVCWPKVWIDDWLDGTVPIQSLWTMASRKGKSDFRDISDIYRPSQKDSVTYSSTAEELVFSCSFDDNACDHRSFQEWNSDNFGICYTFNSQPYKDNATNKEKPKTTSQAGPKHGLHVTLNVLSGIALLSPELGVRVIVHDPDLLPVPDEEGFNLGPGSSSIRVSRTHFHRLGHPHGTCTNSYDPSIPYQYSRLLCKTLCVEQEIRQRCDCYVGLSPVYEFLEDKPEEQCNPASAIQKLCVDLATKEYQSGQRTCNCPNACQEMKYSAQVTSSKVNPLYYNLLHGQRKKIDSLCNSNTEMVNLNIYLESMSYEDIRESPAYTWDTLLSNIGGSLGLFIGVSLVSILEIAEFLLDLGALLAGRWKGGHYNDTHHGRAPPSSNSFWSSNSVTSLDTCNQCLTLKKEVRDIKEEMDVIKLQQALEVCDPDMLKVMVAESLDKIVAEMPKETPGQLDSGTITQRRPLHRETDQAFDRLFLDNQSM